VIRGVMGLICLLATLSLAAADKVDVSSSAYKQEYAKWRKVLDDDRRSNWLTLVGLFWLRDGENRVGGNPKSQVPLPADKVPADVGTISFHDGMAAFRAAPGVTVTNDAKPVQTISLRPDVTGKPTILQIGDLRMHMIQRGGRFGIRVKDMHSRRLAEFREPELYPPSDLYVVTGKLLPLNPPKKINVPTVLGQDAQMESPGDVEFTLQGRAIRLQAIDEDGKLMFIIKDQTSGKATYPAGRFLYAASPKDGLVLLDFNRTENPPCAFTPYATCPLPPRQNWIPVAIEAGEKYSGHH